MSPEIAKRTPKKRHTGTAAGSPGRRQGGSPRQRASRPPFPTISRLPPRRLLGFNPTIRKASADDGDLRRAGEIRVITSSSSTSAASDGVAGQHSEETLKRSAGGPGDLSGYGQHMPTPAPTPLTATRLQPGLERAGGTVRSGGRHQARPCRHLRHLRTDRQADQPRRLLAVRSRVFREAQKELERTKHHSCSAPASSPTPPARKRQAHRRRPEE